MPPLQLGKKYKYFFQVKKDKKIKMIWHTFFYILSTFLITSTSDYASIFKFATPRLANFNIKKLL